MNDPLSHIDVKTRAQLEESVRADIGRGYSLEQIVTSLQASGWTREEAMAATAKFDHAAQADIRKRSARRNSRYRESNKSHGVGQIITGAIMLVVGLAITIGTYMMASGGGVYIITVGLIFWGAIRMALGIYQLMGG